MIFVITDCKGLVGVLEMPGNVNLKQLKKEFDEILDPGPNPYVYNTPIQKAWLEKVKNRDRYLLKYYGRDAEAYKNWLIEEKGASRINYKEIFLVEFD